ncbi:MAG: fused MFS/spermidine synthase [Planctomycetota bacterium]
MPAYAFTIFLSAFLVFQVQLVIAKYILPWFGGAPAVWSACMLFFQAALLAGYAYAHLMVRRLGARRQARLHAAVIAASICLLAGQFLLWRSPLLPPAGWKPDGSALPVMRILGLLAVSVGLPFFVLSATSPLLQAWFSRTHPGRSPYRLYALSNAGSMFGLLSYPFLVEPGLALTAQAWVWSGCYAAFVFGCAWCAIRSGKAEGPAPADGPARDEADSDPPGRGRRLLWFALAACASVLLLATTNQISEEIAAAPFLWALPLSLYLLSFIVCFAGERGYSRALFVCAAVVAMALTGYTMLRKVGNVGIVTYIWTASFTFFVCCMICHGELARLKPSKRHLTSFYLTIAAGGAAGGVFVALIAPVIFTGLWELHLGHLGCAVLLLLVMLRDRGSRFNGRWRLLWRTAAAAGLTVLGGTQALHITEFYASAVSVRRNFYGILRVSEKHAGQPGLHQYALYHARTLHGYQYVDPARARLPTAYFTENSGAGLAIRHHPLRARARSRMRMGMVGLGTGTLAAYGRTGDYIRFYEINPAVAELAAGDGARFTFLRDSAARIDVITGDARISLERELRQTGPQRFDVLVLDAFSGDAIPLHLLTREAFGIYLAHLVPDGVLAVHISNRYFDLRPVIWRLAREFGLQSAAVDSAGGEHAIGARWMLLTRDAALIAALAKLDLPTTSVAAAAEEGAPSPLWTDDYSNLLQVLK